jgi:hypothetical protein
MRSWPSMTRTARRCPDAGPDELGVLMLGQTNSPWTLTSLTSSSLTVATVLGCQWSWTRSNCWSRFTWRSSAPPCGPRAWACLVGLAAWSADAVSRAAADPMGCGGRSDGLVGDRGAVWASGGAVAAGLGFEVGALGCGAGAWRPPVGVSRGRSGGPRAAAGPGCGGQHRASGTSRQVSCGQRRAASQAGTQPPPTATGRRGLPGGGGGQGAWGSAPRRRR